MTQLPRALTVLFTLASVGLPAAFGQDVSIQHDPVRVAVRGQPVSMIAKVSAPGTQVNKVTLFYTLSRHSAPLKVPMTPTGGGLYTASVGANYLERATTLYYYIEAETAGGNWAETTWQAVAVKEGGADTPVRSRPAPTSRNPSTAGTESDDGLSWGTTALIAGAGVGVVVGAIALSDSGGSSSSSGSGGGGGGGEDGGDGSSGENLAGVYNGSVEICFTPSGGSTGCNVQSTTITIEPNGTVSSPDIAQGTPASGVLNGNSFTMTVPASQINPTHEGSVNFSGTVANGTINGSVSGSSTSVVSPGTYSGSFTATR